MTAVVPEIACALTEAEYRERKAQIRRTLTPFMTNSASANGTLTLAFSKPDVTVQMLEELIAFESTCCPFLNFELVETDHVLRLLVSGPKGSEELVNDLFANANDGACCSG